MSEAMTSDSVKGWARQLGADLVGIAPAARLDAHPPDPGHPRTPRAILGEHAQSVLVIGVRMLAGAARIPRWDDRQKHHTQELGLSSVEEISYKLVLRLEELGFPSITLPPMHTEAEPRFSAALSLRHAAVEAGLGTLGLGGQLLTREFGPRVHLGGVVTAAVLSPDEPLAEALCLGEACGRCLLACPADAIGAWELDKEACAPFAAPYGYGFVQDYLRRMVRESDETARLAMIGSTDTLMIWQSMLRSVGSYTGCANCLEVCPVGADYDRLRDARDVLPPIPPQRQARFDALLASGALRVDAAGALRQRRWVAGPGADTKEVTDADR